MKRITVAFWALVFMAGCSACGQPSVGIVKTAPLSGAGTTTDPMKIDVCPNGQAHISNGSSWTCAAAAGGDITAVTTASGSGLAGGCTSGACAVSLLGTCGSGQMEKWNGSAWACADDNGITSITPFSGLTTIGADAVGIMACGTPPNTILKYSGGAWTCAPDADSGGDVTSVVAGSNITGGCTSGPCTVGVVSSPVFSGTVEADTLSADTRMLAPQLETTTVFAASMEYGACNGNFCDIGGTTNCNNGISQTCKDWAPTKATIYDLALSNGSATLTGIDPTIWDTTYTPISNTQRGPVIWLHNTSATNSLTLTNNDSTSAAGHRIKTPDAASMVIPPLGNVQLAYSYASFWVPSYNGDITSVGATANMGLTGGSTSGAATLGLLSTCSATQALVYTGSQWNCSNGTDVLSNIATSRILGRTTAGSGDSEELTGTQATALLDAFSSSLKGLAPSSGGGTTNYLRADGTWAAPAGSGAMTIGGTVTSGTTGSMLFVGSGPVLAQNNSKVFWNDTTHRLGIGTATPGYPLDVQSSDAADAYRAVHVSGGTANSGDGGAYLFSGDPAQAIVGSGIIYVSGVGWTMKTSSTASYFAQYQGDANFATATGGGYGGAATTTDRLKFDHTGGVEILNSDSASVSDSSAGRLRYQSTGQKMQISMNAGTYQDVTMEPATDHGTPSANHGSLGTGSIDKRGNITSIGSNTSVTLTYSTAVTRSWCFAQPNNQSVSLQTILVTNSASAPVFTCIGIVSGLASNCDDFSYHCDLE